MEEKRSKESRIITQINRAVLNALVSNVAHLADVDIDLDPRHEASWFVGGIEIPSKIKKIFESIPWKKEIANVSMNRTIQYTGSPLLSLRHQFPLESCAEFVKFTNEQIAAVPTFKYDPRTIGYSHDYRPITTIPGFWPGSKHEFGLLSYHSRHSVDKLQTNEDDDFQYALHAQGILASFSWLFGQACYQGFSTFQDLTYPLSTQTIITDGQFWSFYVYQMNTTLLHQDAIDTNTKINQCWATKELKLYDNIDDQGVITGWNDDVLRHLIHFYINEPKQRTIEMTPYLGEQEKRAANIAHTARRIFVEKHYKHLVSNRPRHLLIPEIYNWEKIYKIDNNTLPLSAKRRFFELKINPFARRLDEHTPVYIPKVIRPGGPKSKDKWEKTYYPDA